MPSPAPYLLRLLIRNRLPPASERRLKPEQKLTVAVANMLRAETLAGNIAGTRWFHVKNEHEASGRNAALQVEIGKAMGAIGGAPDFTFGRSEFCGDIEMKTSTGRLSPSQKDFREWDVFCGVPYVVCTSVDEVRDTLIDWGALKPQIADINRRAKARTETTDKPTLQGEL